MDLGRAASRRIAPATSAGAICCYYFWFFLCGGGGYEVKLKEGPICGVNKGVGPVEMLFLESTKSQKFKFLNKFIGSLFFSSGLRSVIGPLYKETCLPQIGT